MRKGFLLAALLFAASAFGQYPAKPVRLIVPLVPGGNQDIVARVVAEELSKGLGQQVIVENRPGQSAIIGTQFVKSAPADGYTLLSVAVTFARVPAVVKAAGYDPAADFAGVSLVCRIPQVLVLTPSHPAKNLQELIALAKAKPGEVSFGSSGNGSTGHVAAEMFMRMTGTRLLHVTYKGNAQAIVDVMGGQVAMMFDQVSTSGSHVKGGKLRALGVTTKARSAVLPEVPTLHEQGLTDFEDVTWNGIVAPAGTPRDVISKLHATVARALASPELQKRYGERGIEIVASRSPEEFSAYVKSEADAFARLVRDAGIKVE
ncbi:MAG TPA: tripartite tricarboxylate transporter substrate binding protein [Burkholderiales bacterium]